MKRSPLKRKKRIRSVNPERRAERRAETDGPCADLARSLPCLVWSNGRSLCVGPTEPDHVRARGAGGKDAGNVVPLCSGHHSERHTIGIRTFERRYGIDLEAEARKIAERVAAREGGS